MIWLYVLLCWFVCAGVYVSFLCSLVVSLFSVLIALFVGICCLVVLSCYCLCCGSYGLLSVTCCFVLGFGTVCFEVVCVLLGGLLRFICVYM